MANFIEVQDGIFVRSDAITAIRKPDAKESRPVIFTHHRKWFSDMPFETILSMIKSDESDDRQMSENARTKSTMDKLDAVLGKVGHFAG